MKKILYLLIAIVLMLNIFSPFDVFAEDYKFSVATNVGWFGILYPTNTANYTDWTGIVDDINEDWKNYNDNEYIASNVDSDNISFVFSPWTTNATFVSVQLVIRCKKVYAADDIVLLYREDGQNYSLGSLSPTGSFADIAKTFSMNPATGVSWNFTSINGMEWVLQKTGTAGFVYVTHLYARVTPSTICGSDTIGELSVLSELNSQSIIDGGYTFSSFLNTTMTGADAYMPVSDRMTIAIDGLAYQETEITTLNMGYTAVQKGFSVIPGTNGYITISENETVSIEPGLSLNITQDGYINTTNGSGSIIYKPEAFATYIPDSYNVTGEILQEFVDVYLFTYVNPYDYKSIYYDLNHDGIIDEIDRSGLIGLPLMMSNSHIRSAILTDPPLWNIVTGNYTHYYGWFNGEFAWDNNVATNATVVIPPNSWSEYINFTFPETDTCAIRWFASPDNVGEGDIIDTDIYSEMTGWANIWEGDYSPPILPDSWTTANLTGIFRASQMRMRFFNSTLTQCTTNLTEVRYGTVNYVTAVNAPCASGEKIVNTRTVPYDPPMKQALIGGNDTDLATGVQYFAMQGDGYSTTEADVQQIVSSSGYLFALRTALDMAPGAGQNYVSTVRVNGVDTVLTCTISDANMTGSDLITTTGVTAGDAISLGVTGSATPTSSNMTYSVMYQSLSSNTSLVMASGVNSLVDTAANTNSSLMSAYREWTTTGFASRIRQIVPTYGSFQDMYISLSNAPGVGNSYTFTLYVNGAATDVSVTFSGVETSNHTHESTYCSPGDYVYVRCIPSGTPTAASVKSGISFLADINGESLLMNSSIGTMTAGVSENSSACGVTNGLGVWVGVGPEVMEYKNQLTQNATLRNLYAYYQLADTSNITVYVNGNASVLTCGVSGGVAASNLTSNVDVLDGDIILVQKENNTTVGNRVSWSMVSYIYPICFSTWQMQMRVYDAGYDLNNDGYIDNADIAIFLLHFNVLVYANNPAYYILYDLNLDDRVDEIDVLVIDDIISGAITGPPSLIAQADFDNSGTVDAADKTILQAHVNPIYCDFNSDGIIDIIDYAILIAATSPTVYSVPIWEGVPDSSSAWIIQATRVMPYMNMFRYSMGNIDTITYRPESIIPVDIIESSVLTEQRNYGVITYGQNLSGITVWMDSLSSADVYDVVPTPVPASLYVGPPSSDAGMDPTAAEIELLVQELPLYTIFKTAADKLGFPTAAVYGIFLVSFAMGVGFLAYVISGVIIAGVLTSSIVMAMGLQSHLIPIWFIMVYILAAAALIYLRNRL